QQPDPPEVTPVAPADGRRVGLGVGGEGAQHVGAVRALPHGRVDGVGGQLARREVAQVLVHPVRHQAAEHPLPPPRGGAHVLDPGGRGVPVIDHVVIVEDHAGGDGGQQPAHLRVEPGLVVEVGVLLVVRHLAARGLAQVAAGGEPGAGGLGGLVGVHLVAQQEQHVRPFAARVGRDAGGEGVQRVGADGVVFAGGRGGPAAGAEGDARVVGRPGGGDHRRRQGVEGGVGQRPDAGAVEVHLVRRGGARGQPRHLDEGVVVAGDLEGARPAAGPVRAAHLGGARAARLGPDGRGRAVDVAQQWSEPQSGHVVTPSSVAPYGTQRRRPAARTLRSAVREVSLEGGLLGGVDGQAVVVLHLDPGACVGAAVGGAGGHPGGRVLVALGLVDVVGDGDQLRAGQVVGEGLAPGGGPRVGAGVPRLGERHHVVDVDVGGGGPGRAVVGGVPAAAGRGARGGGDDVGAVALEDRLAGVAGAADRDPVREEVAVVAGAVLGGDLQGGEVAAGGGGADRGGEGGGGGRAVEQPGRGYERGERRDGAEPSTRVR